MQECARSPSASLRASPSQDLVSLPGEDKAKFRTLIATHEALRAWEKKVASAERERASRESRERRERAERKKQRREKAKKKERKQRRGEEGESPNCHIFLY